MKFSTATTLTTLLALSSASPVPFNWGSFISLIPKRMSQFRRDQCDLSKPELPQCEPPLPAPKTNTHLSLVAIGHGTQNYTCADSTAASLPAAAGAVATLYNASCIASSMPEALPRITAAAEDAPESMMRMMPSIGHHYFSDGTTAVFDVNGIGKTSLRRVNSSVAPPNNNGNVPWLLLETKPEGTNSKVLNIYRVHTAGGSAPATCEGQPPQIQVKYATEYWFYSTA